MSLSNFAVSKRNNDKVSLRTLDEMPPDTHRTRILSNALLELRSERDVIQELTKLWSEAQEKFLAIGRYLVLAKARFPGTFERDIVGALPFGRQTAYQLRCVAEAVDGRRLAEETLPFSYATAFQLSKLTEADLALAGKRGLVRSDVTRSEVIAFKREITTERLTRGDHKNILLEEKRRIATEQQRMAERTRILVDRIAEIDRELSRLS
jgi:hypothetical protein